MGYIPSFRIVVIKAMRNAIDDSLGNKAWLESIIINRYFAAVGFRVLLGELKAVFGCEAKGLDHFGT